MALLETILANGFGGLLANLATEQAKRGVDVGISESNIKTNLEPYFKSIFEKCTKIKTLLNPDEPALLLQIHATQRFSRSGETIDHYELVEEISKGRAKKLIITGTGGSGKSIFARYLWLSLFSFPSGKIPIYYDLKNVNTQEDIDIMKNIYYELTRGSAKISFSKFCKLFESGKVLLVGDGFDEVYAEKQDAVRDQIIQISYDYPDVDVILTSRPDDDFGSWPTFSIVQVESFNKEDVLELIEKCEFDASIKSEFYVLVDKKLFQTHESFLKNPLLASMMLLTYHRNKDIPDKMHIFYEEAYSALYKRHDRNKPGKYKRQFSTEIGEDKFKKLFSIFCFSSYYAEDYEFKEQDIIRYIDVAKKVSKIECDSRDFLKDVESAVCLITREGLSYQFSHRSFQEYFAAYCISSYSLDIPDQVINDLVLRRSDNFAKLFHDMNYEKFRDTCLLPMSKKFEKVISGVARRSNVLKYIDSMEFHGRAFFRNDGLQGWMLRAEGDLSSYVDLIARISANNGDEIIIRDVGYGVRDLFSKIGEELNANLYDSIGITFEGGSVSVFGFNPVNEENGRNKSSAVSRMENYSDGVALQVTDAVEVAYFESSFFRACGDNMKKCHSFVEAAKSGVERERLGLEELFR